MRIARASLIAVLALAAAALAGYGMSRYGPGLTPDSADYIRVARLLDQHQLNLLFHNDAVLQPPGYPLLLSTLAAIPTLNLDHVQAAGLINLIAAPLIVILTAILTIAAADSRNPIRRFTAPLIAASLCTLSVPLLVINTRAWTEPLFIALALAVIALAALRRPSIATALCLAALIAAAFYIRYAAVTLIPIAMLALLTPPHPAPHTRARNILRRFAPLLVFTLTTTTIIAAAIARNLAVSGTTLGQRAPSRTTLRENLRLVREVLEGWFIPMQIDWLTVIPTLALLAAGCTALWLTIDALAQSARRPFASHNPRPHDARRRTRMLLLAYLITYTSFIVITSTTTAYNRLDDRLLAPIFPPLAVFIALALTPTPHSRMQRDAHDPRASRNPQAALRTAVCLIALAAFTTLYLRGPAARALSQLHHQRQYGAGFYQTTRWRNSELVHAAAELPQRDKNAAILSNAPGALILHANLNARLAPALHEHNSDQTTGINKHTIAALRPDVDQAFLIWFDGVAPGGMFPIDQLKDMIQLTLIRKLDEGAIYRLALPRENQSATQPANTR